MNSDAKARQQQYDNNNNGDEVIEEEGSNNNEANDNNKISSQRATVIRRTIDPNHLKNSGLGLQIAQILHQKILKKRQQLQQQNMKKQIDQNEKPTNAIDVPTLNISSFENSATNIPEQKPHLFMTMQSTPKGLSVPKITITSPPSDTDTSIETNPDSGIEFLRENRCERLEDVKRILNRQIILRKLANNASNPSYISNSAQSITLNSPNAMKYTFQRDSGGTEATTGPATTSTTQQLPQQTTLKTFSNIELPSTSDTISTSIVDNATNVSPPIITVRKFHTIASPEVIMKVQCNQTLQPQSLQQSQYPFKPQSQVFLTSLSGGPITFSSRTETKMTQQTTSAALSKPLITPAQHQKSGGSEGSNVIATQENSSLGTNIVPVSITHQPPQSPEYQQNLLNNLQTTIISSKAIIRPIRLPTNATQLITVKPITTLSKSPQRAALQMMSPSVRPTTQSYYHVPTITASTPKVFDICDFNQFKQPSLKEAKVNKSFLKASFQCKNQFPTATMSKKEHSIQGECIKATEAVEIESSNIELEPMSDNEGHVPDSINNIPHHQSQLISIYNEEKEKGVTSLETPSSSTKNKSLQDMRKDNKSPKTENVPIVLENKLLKPGEQIDLKGLLSKSNDSMPQKRIISAKRTVLPAKSINNNKMHIIISNEKLKSAKIDMAALAKEVLERANKRPCTEAAAKAPKEPLTILPKKRIEKLVERRSTEVYDQTAVIPFKENTSLLIKSTTNSLPLTPAKSIENNVERSVAVPTSKMVSTNKLAESCTEIIVKSGVVLGNEDTSPKILAESSTDNSDVHSSKEESLHSLKKTAPNVVKTVAALRSIKSGKISTEAIVESGFFLSKGDTTQSTTSSRKLIENILQNTVTEVQQRSNKVPKTESPKSSKSVVITTENYISSTNSKEGNRTQKRRPEISKASMTRIEKSYRQPILRQKARLREKVLAFCGIKESSPISPIKEYPKTVEIVEDEHSTDEDISMPTAVDFIASLSMLNCTYTVVNAATDIDDVYQTDKISSNEPGYRTKDKAKVKIQQVYDDKKNSTVRLSSVESIETLERNTKKQSLEPIPLLSKSSKYVSQDILSDTLTKSAVINNSGKHDKTPTKDIVTQKEREKDKSIADKNSFSLLNKVSKIVNDTLFKGTSNDMDSSVLNVLQDQTSVDIFKLRTDTQSKIISKEIKLSGHEDEVLISEVSKNTADFLSKIPSQQMSLRGLEDNVQANLQDQSMLSEGSKKDTGTILEKISKDTELSGLKDNVPANLQEQTLVSKVSKNGADNHSKKTSKKVKIRGLEDNVASNLQNQTMFPEVSKCLSKKIYKEVELSGLMDNIQANLQDQITVSEVSKTDTDTHSKNTSKDGVLRALEDNVPSNYQYQSMLPEVSKNDADSLSNNISKEVELSSLADNAQSNLQNQTIISEVSKKVTDNLSHNDPNNEKYDVTQLIQKSKDVNFVGGFSTQVKHQTTKGKECNNSSKDSGNYSLMTFKDTESISTRNTPQKEADINLVNTISKQITYQPIFNASKQRPTLVTNASAATSTRKRIGIRNAPINLIPRKKPAVKRPVTNKPSTHVSKDNIRVSQKQEDTETVKILESSTVFSKEECIKIIAGKSKEEKVETKNDSAFLSQENKAMEPCVTIKPEISTDLHVVFQKTEETTENDATTAMMNVSYEQEGPGSSTESIESTKKEDISSNLHKKLDFKTEFESQTETKIPSLEDPKFPSISLPMNLEPNQEKFEENKGNASEKTPSEDQNYEGHGIKILATVPNVFADEIDLNSKEVDESLSSTRGSEEGQHTLPEVGTIIDMKSYGLEKSNGEIIVLENVINSKNQECNQECFQKETTKDLDKPMIAMETTFETKRPQSSSKSLDYKDREIIVLENVFNQKERTKELEKSMIVKNNIETGCTQSSSKSLDDNFLQNMLNLNNQESNQEGRTKTVKNSLVVKNSFETDPAQSSSKSLDVKNREIIVLHNQLNPKSQEFGQEESIKTSKKSITFKDNFKAEPAPSSSKSLDDKDREIIVLQNLLNSNNQESDQEKTIKTENSLIVKNNFKSEPLRSSGISLENGDSDSQSCHANDIIDYSDRENYVSVIGRKRLRRKRPISALLATSGSENATDDDEERTKHPLSPTEKIFALRNDISSASTSSEVLGFTEKSLTIISTTNEKIQTRDKELILTTNLTTNINNSFDALKKSESKCTSPFVPIGSRRNVPLKKRWELSKLLSHDETDITDDTSPAADDTMDDEEVENKILEEAQAKTLKDIKLNFHSDSLQELNYGKSPSETLNYNKETSPNIIDASVSKSVQPIETYNSSKRIESGPAQVDTELSSKENSHFQPNDRSEENILSISPAKRRGRPPKKVKKDVNTSVNSLENNSEMEEVKNICITSTPIILAKKRRGCKPRLVNESKDSSAEMETDNENSESDSFKILLSKLTKESHRRMSLDEKLNMNKTEVFTTPAPVQKKRGRKPHAKTSIENQQQIELESMKSFEGISNQDNTPSTSIQAQKKRGRKPRQSNIDINQELQVNISQTEPENLKDCLSANESNLPLQKNRGPKPCSGNENTPIQRAMITNDESSDFELPSRKKSRQNAFELQQAQNLIGDELTIVKVKANLAKERGGKPQPTNFIVNGSETSNIQETIQANPSQQKYGGRKKKIDVVDDFNPRLLLIRQRDQLNTEEVLTVPDSEAGNGPLQCGLCLERTTHTKWQKHLGEHYGVGWIVGNDQAINIKSRCKILNTMTAYFKRQETTLPCRLCLRTYRSALGLLLHIESCGETIRLECPNCGNHYTKLSYSVHVRTCEKVQSGESDKNEEEEPVKTIEPVLNNSGRFKRVSLMKAETKLKKMSKELSTNVALFQPKNFIRFRRNSTEDKNEEGKFYCTACTQSNICFENEADAIKHVLRIHKQSNQESLDFEGDSSDFDENAEGPEESEEESSTDDDINSAEIDTDVDIKENEDDNKVMSKKGSTKKISKVIKRRPWEPKNAGNLRLVYSRRCADVHKLVLHKWKRFIRSNFIDETLYPYAKTVYDDESQRKIQLTEKESMKFTFSMKHKPFKVLGMPETLDWQNVQRFQSIDQRPSDKFIFLGAPIKTIAWAPLPEGVSDQYLVVSCRRDLCSFTRCKNPKKEDALLIVYKISTGADDSNAKKRDFQSKIHYVLCVPNGPVHTMAFLPSGGYDLATNRLGLLAIGSASSNITIYALPIQPVLFNELKVKETDEIAVVSLKPALELILNANTDTNESESQCIHICWSEFSGHQHIFACYVNSFIAIWDIKEPDDAFYNLNCQKRDGCHCFTPLNYFYFGEKVFKSFAIHYDTIGPRWLAIHGCARKLIIYDIRNLSYPVPIKEDSLKNVPRDIDWSPIWETFVTIFCDSIPNHGSSATVFNPVGVKFTHSKMDSMVCGVSTLHYNPWQSIYGIGVDNGDIIYINTRELNHDQQVLTRSKKNVMALSVLDIKRLDGDTLIKPESKDNIDNWQMNEKDYKEKYGLVFTNICKITADDRSAYLSDKRTPPTNVERYMRTNILRWNLNVLGKRYVAIGYENGFLRLTRFKRDAYFD